jgi:hypothetical protein
MGRLRTARYPLHRLLDQRLFTADAQKLLWKQVPAQRPKPCPTPTRHDDRIQPWIQIVIRDT